MIIIYYERSLGYEKICCLLFLFNISIVKAEEISTPEEILNPEEISTPEITTMSYPTPIGQVIWKTKVIWSSSPPPFALWYDDGTFQGFLYIQNKWYGGGNYRTNYGGLVRKYVGLIPL